MVNINVLGLVTVNMWILFAAIVALFITFIVINFVNKTVGLRYAFMLFKMKKKFNKDKVLLKIWLANGKPQYQIKPVSNFIEYTYKENGKTKTGMVKYDYYSMYKEFADIPVLECDPHDILPRNPFTNTSLTLSGEVIKKNITDAGKEDIAQSELWKNFKKAMPILAVFGAILILYSSNQGDQVAELTRQLVQCYASQSKTATIIGG